MTSQLMETSTSRLIDVLIVDDERMILGVASEIISEFGHRVSVAENGLVALNLLANSPIDLIITDVMMPHMTGIELSREVKHQYPAVHVALMTGYSSVALMQEAEEMGITECLKKPFKTWELMGIVDRVASTAKAV